MERSDGADLLGTSGTGHPGCVAHDPGIPLVSTAQGEMLGGITTLRGFSFDLRG